MAKGPFEVLHFLIVDDNAHMRQIVETVLRAWGATKIFHAADGADGLGIAGTWSVPGKRFADALGQARRWRGPVTQDGGDPRLERTLEVGAGAGLGMLAKL